MADIDFQPEKRTVENLFVGADYYIIPRFQRPYSWSQTNLEDFWRDVVFDNKLGYFIGPMVAWTEKSSANRRVVDGQQRLTTIAIIFAVLRDALLELKEKKLAEGVDRYLLKPDRNNEPQFTLQTEVEARYLSQAIFRNPPDSSVKPVTEEERALAGAVSQIRKLVREEVTKRSKPVPWLLELRDKLLGLQVIWVEHGNEDDAYIIFETLNSRGKDLEVVDLLKNLLLSQLRNRASSTAADTVRSQWNDMRAEFESARSGSRINANQFILHWWLSQEKYVAQRKLYRDVKAKIKTRPAARERLDSLIADAPLYRAAREPASRLWHSSESEVQRSLQALADFGIVQPAPLLLSLLRARFASNPALKVPQLRSALLTIERYHFQYTVVGQLSSSGGVSEMYAKAARELADATDTAKQVAALDGIRAKLVDRRPAEDQFLAAFSERFLCLDDSTEDAKLVRYVLGRILNYISPTTGQESLTIEHIMSQSAIKGGADRAMVGSIGNLLLVSESLNTKLASKSFEAKKKILDSSEGRPYDIGGVLDQSQWTDVEIAARTEMLGKLAYQKVWKLPV